MANFLEETAKEFKDAPPGGKALAIVALLAVAGIGLYAATHHGTSSNSQVLPVDLSTVPDTGVPFANMPANPPISTGATNTPHPPPFINPHPGLSSGTWLGPSGVRHYTIQSGDGTLAQLAARFGIGWNDISAIPANQKAFGGSKGASYKPPAGTVITLPNPPSSGGGGPMYSKDAIGIYSAPISSTILR